MNIYKWRHYDLWMLNNDNKWQWILMFSDVTQLSFMPSFNFMAFYQKNLLNAFMNHWRKSKLHSILYVTEVFMAVNHWSFAHFLRIKHFWLLYTWDKTASTISCVIIASILLYGRKSFIISEIFAYQIFFMAKFCQLFPSQLS